MTVFKIPDIITCNAIQEAVPDKTPMSTAPCNTILALHETRAALFSNNTLH